MSDEMTPSQQAAAFHGIAINRGFPPADRFQAAIQALDMYEAEVERLHTWTGIMSLVDEHYPVDIFPVIDDSADRDSGSRILSLLRRLDEARAELAALRRQLVEARATIEKARDLVGDLVRADNNGLGHGANGRIVGNDTLPLQQLLGMSLTLRYAFEGTEDETRDRLRRALDDRDILWRARADAEAELERMRAVVEAAQAWRDQSAGSILGAHERPLAAAVDAYRTATPSEEANDG